MVPQWLIEKKRDGQKLTAEEIAGFVTAYSEGRLPDYQMAAMAMAIYFSGMDVEETAALTDTMMRSGDVIEWEDCPMPTADKHSTGGIGDKISLPLAPLVATQNVAVPMISGRGLGITGGTLDKLESIPGYNVSLDVDAFKRQVATVGCSIIGQTAALAPADRKLYALRDVTGTVPSIPLITASIMSKKLAEGAASLVFDVKYGRAAFMKTRDDAIRLRDGLVNTALECGRKASAVLTNMDVPHGRAIGNALEVAESVDILKNAGPADVRELTLALGVEMVALASPERETAEIRSALEKALASGAALGRFRAMVEAQGGDARFIDEPTRLPQASAALEIRADCDLTVEDVDAAALGRVVLELGGGRRAVSDSIDPGAGIDRLVQVGEKVSKGEVLMRLMASSESLVRQHRAAALAAMRFSAVE